MKRQASRFTWIVLFAVVLCSCAEKQNVLTEQEKLDGWKLLFDGQSTKGWRDYNAKDITGWIAENGCLAASGTGSDSTGYIVADQQYNNFELNLDWKIAAEGNSGLIYHVIEGKKFKTPYMTGPEYQLLDDVGFPQKVEEWQKTGADYAMTVANPALKKLNPVGQWNSARIIFDNGHVEHWLNGKRVLSYRTDNPEAVAGIANSKFMDVVGYADKISTPILLQDHETTVWFRNLKVRELPAK